MQKKVRYTYSQMVGNGALNKKAIMGQLRNVYEFDLTQPIHVERDSDSVYFCQEADEDFHTFMDRKGREMAYNTADTFGARTRSF